MSNPDIEVSRVIHGADLLSAFAEFDLFPLEPERWAANIDNGANIGLIARSIKLGRQAVGTGTLRREGVLPHETAFRETLHGVYQDEETPAFYGLMVSELVRRHGFGRAIMLAAEKVVIQDPNLPNRIGLTVQTTNKAGRALYKDLEYKKHGIIKVENVPVLGDDGVWTPRTVKSVVMSKDLQSE